MAVKLHTRSRMPEHDATAATLPAADLATLVRECFEGVGIGADDAHAVAEVLVDANLRGLESHGFSRVPIYMRRVHEGLANGTERMTVVSEHGAVCRLDANHALGPAVGVRAIDRAIELALEHGCGLVTVGNSTHFGAAGYYARRAAERGLFALAASNGPANMAPHGAAERFLGTNAMAIAAPLGAHGEFVFDSSSSVVARGKVIRAQALGETIEPGIAIDPAGRPTQDAAAALAGAMLPAAGAKGSGLAMAISILVAVLGGADFDDELAPMYGNSARAQNVGHVFLAIDPARFGDPSDATARLEEMVERLHSLPVAENFDAVRFPGEASAARAQARLENGIPIDPAELRAASQACLECGLVELAERFSRSPLPQTT